MFDATTVALADVAEIRGKVPGATVNDVVLTTVGGALRKYLAKHKELPKDSLVAVAPINLRGKGGKAATPGNQVSAMSVHVSTDLAGPPERLASHRDYPVQAREDKAGVNGRIMTDLAPPIPRTARGRRGHRGGEKR